MNKIQRQKGGLLIFGIIAFIVSILFVVFGILLLVKGIGNVGDDATLAIGIIKIVLGAIMCLLFFPSISFAIYAVSITLAMKATKGSIKMDNIAKEGGTVNMRKCDKCGTELKDGETVCSNCGKEFK